VATARRREREVPRSAPRKKGAFKGKSLAELNSKLKENKKRRAGLSGAATGRAEVAGPGQERDGEGVRDDSLASRRVGGKDERRKGSRGLVPSSRLLPASPPWLATACAGPGKGVRQLEEPGSRKVKLRKGLKKKTAGGPVGKLVNRVLRLRPHWCCRFSCGRLG